MSQQFTAGIKNSRHGEDQSFATREEAEQWLLDQQGYGHFNMWLNNEPVRIQGGRVVLCKLADAAQVIATTGQAMNTLARTNADFNRLFRPQPTRGSAPTNPNTLEAAGKLDGEA